MSSQLAATGPQWTVVPRVIIYEEIKVLLEYEKTEELLLIGGLVFSGLRLFNESENLKIKTYSLYSSCRTYAQYFYVLK